MEGNCFLMQEPRFPNLDCSFRENVFLPGIFVPGKDMGHST